MKNIVKLFIPLVLILFVSCKQEAVVPDVEVPKLVKVEDLTDLKSHDIPGAKKKNSAGTGIPITQPTAFITDLTANGLALNWTYTNVPDTVRVVQILLSTDAAFPNNSPNPTDPTTTWGANIFWNTSMSVMNYLTFFQIPSTWFTGSRFVRIQGDYIAPAGRGLFFSNTVTVNN